MSATDVDTGEFLGYRHPEYAHSLAEHGVPRELECSGGWVLERPIPGTPYRDAMGLYPLFSCRAWSALPDDLPGLHEAGLVSLVLVTDPMLEEDERGIFDRFAVARPFKTHYLAVPDLPAGQTVSRHHRYYVRKAAKALEVDVPDHPAAYLDEWSALYARLAERHGFADMRAFSREGFRRLLSMPGIILFRALLGGRPVGAQIVLLQGDVAHAHLAAFTDEGYRHGASYLLDWHALEFLRGRCRYLNWGGGTGLSGADDSGLARYKQGWSTERRLTYLLGAVLDQDLYARLGGAGTGPEQPYFPRYRAGEFG